MQRIPVGVEPNVEIASMTSTQTATGPVISATYGGTCRPKPWQLIKRAMLVLQVARERRALAALDDRMLEDIGLSRSQVYLESSRGMLDLPDYRVDL